MAVSEKGMSIEPSDSHNSQSPPASTTDSSSTKKRGTSSAGLDSNGNPKPVKRRAAKACAACRARKVRCDVMQRYHISPEGTICCSNCTMDGITCVIEESKRRKKQVNGGPATATTQESQSNNGPPRAWGNGLVNPSNLGNQDARRWSGSAMSNEDEYPSHVPHAIYQNVNQQIDKGENLRRAGYIHQNPQYDDAALHALLTSAAPSGDRTRSRVDDEPPIHLPPLPMLKHVLPGYLKPLPQRMTSVDIDYLFAKGALSLPEDRVRNALLVAYLEYVNPYMPLIEVHETLRIIDDGTGEFGRISLLLFQAIMFAGTAFVDMEYLRAAGYSNRKAARKAFFQKARVLYDFDYEIDRVSLVQSLLLMTYWYETPDDQKDTWHWMGVAISLAHTIGLHRDPSKSMMEPPKQSLWKRIWWSCFMRDRLIALGMRRPTRVKDEDYDVPMLTEADFEIEPIDEDIAIIPENCDIARKVGPQRQLAQMCIAKAKLCLCISHVLSAQYSVLVKYQGSQTTEGSTRSSVMLIPKKLNQTDEVKRCDVELTKWYEKLPGCCKYIGDVRVGDGGPSVFVQRALLHMVYFTTLSALHRPQVLPSVAAPNPENSKELQDISRKKVREASKEITRISQDLHSRGLEKYLPTTGVTVLLPAIIIHLLDIKSCNDEARQQAMDGFCQCMLVLEKLRDNYSSADFATQFLEAAIRKAEIEVVIGTNGRSSIQAEDVQANLNSEKVRELRMRSKQVAVLRRPGTPPVLEVTNTPSMRYTVPMPQEQAQTPQVVDILVQTPPDSETQTNFETDTSTMVDMSQSGGMNGMNAYENVEMTDFFNFNEAGTAGNDLVFEEEWHGESGGMFMDMNMDWSDQTVRWSRMGTPVPGVEADMFGNMNGNGIGTNNEVVDVKP